MDSFEEYLKKSYVFNADLGCWARAGAEGFKYSDGDEVENNILSIIQQAKDLGSISLELAQKCTDWPTTYHLSPKRSNLLRPLSAVLKGRILEIGAGLGAVTRYIGEQGGQVLALEGSLRRASAIKARCRDLENVTVLAESFHQFDAVAEFDVIVLVGVLEYARKFFPSEADDPVKVMLDRARRLLRPGGVLILAIENQLGLKYFAGAPEDHTGVSMYGIEDLYENDTVVTFGRRELQERLALSGFPAQNWWFPFPDYKLPVTVLSSNIVEHKADLSPVLAHSVGVDMQMLGGKTFSLEQAWGVILRNGLVPDLANSFLVLASDVEESTAVDDHKTLGYYFSVNRRLEFAKEIMFQDVGLGKVQIRKKALYPSIPSIEKNPLSMELNHEEFLDGVNWQARLCRIVNKPGWSLHDVESWAQVWYDAMLTYGKISAPRESLTPGYQLPGDLFDVIPRNLILTKDTGPHFFDQEWRLKVNIELGYLLFRGIYLELINLTNTARPAAGTPLNIYKLFQLVARSLGLQVNGDDLARYADLERNVLFWAAGMTTWLTPRDLMSRSLNIRASLTSAADGQADLTPRRIISRIVSKVIRVLKRIVPWK